MVAGRALLADAASAGDGGVGDDAISSDFLVAITMACGAAAGVTIALAPAYADYSAKGY